MILQIMIKQKFLIVKQGIKSFLSLLLSAHYSMLFIILYKNITKLIALY